MLSSGTKPQAELRIKGLVATAAGNGLRVAPGARVLLAAIWALVPVANGADFPSYAFAARALLVEQYAQFFQPIACDSSFVNCDRVMPMMVVAAWSAVDAIRQVNQFMRYGHFDRLGLHVWLDENEVLVVDWTRLNGRLDGDTGGSVALHPALI